MRPIDVSVLGRKMRTYSSIRLGRWLPIVVAGTFALLLSASAFWRDWRETSNAEAGARELVRERLTGERHHIEQMLRLREAPLAVEEVAQFGSAPEVVFLALVNDQGRVISSTQPLMVDHSMSDVLTGPDVARLRLAQRDHQLLMDFDATQQYLLAYQPLRLAAQLGQGRPIPVGGLLLKYDLAPARARARREVLISTFTEIVLAFLAMTAVMLILRRWLSRPLEYLREAVSRISEGDFTTKVVISGRGELAELGAAIGRMQADLGFSIAERDRSMQALLESEQRFRTIFDAEPECVKVVGSSGELLEMNPAGLAMLEAASVDEVRSRGLNGFIVPEYRAAFDALHESAMGGKVGVLEFEVTGLRGTRRWLEAHSAPLPDADGNVTMTLAVTRDITERKQAEKALRQLSSAVEQTADHVIITDRNGVIEYVNAAFEKSTGYTKEETLGKTPRLVKSGKQGAAFYEHLWQRILAGEVFRAQFINKKKNGDFYCEEKTIAPMRNAHGDITHFVSTGRDITERKKVDLALQESEGRYRAMVERSSEPLIVHRGGQVLYANPATVEMFGATSAQDLVGKPVLNLVHPDFRQPTLARMKLVGGQGADAPTTQMKFLKLDGTEIDVEAQGTSIVFDGEPAIQSTARDITAPLRAERMQSALHKISEAAHSAPDLPGLFRRIHEIISELLPAKNFYVALYDENSDTVSFPYFVDEFDSTPEPRLLKNDRGLTGVVLRSGEPLLLSPDSMNIVALRPDVQLIGTDGLDRLGIPLKTGRGTIGVLTVQTYSGSVRYTEKDKELLQFVSDHVAAAVERMQAQQAVKESEERFRSVFDQSPIIICLVSFPDGEFQEVNAAGIEAFGFSREELLGHTLVDLNIWVDLDERQRYLELLRATGSAHNFEARLRRHNGEIFTVLSNGSFVTLGDRTFSLNSLQDISERKRAEQWQQHYSDTLSLITAEAPIAVVLESLAIFAERQAEGMLCSILLLSPDGKRLLHGAAPSLPISYNQAIDGIAIGPDVGCCGAAAFSGCMVIAEDVMSHPNWAPWRELATQAGLRACWSHPILSSNHKVLGTFAIYRREPSVPSAKDLELIRQSAGLAAIALERAQHHADLRLAKVVFEQSIEGIMVTDVNDHVLMVNQTFESLTGLSAAEVVGHLPMILDPGHDNPMLHATRRDSMASTGRWKGELWGRKKSGEIYPLAMSIATVHDAGGSPSHFINIISDVSDQKIQAARIEQLAFYDSLTGLPNRALFLDRLEQSLAVAKRRGGHGAILFLDLNRFKEINDSLGHAVGDLALAEVARRFQATARKEETLARLGGDEFVLIAENADVETAVGVALRLQSALAEPLDLVGHPYSIAASIGIAFYPADAQTSEDLIKRTDIAMYRAKASGGGYRLYQAEMGAELEKRLNVAQHLTHALEAGELQLYYQPQINLASGRVIGAEALLRWNDPVLGWVSPAEFIPIAEERGMMGLLGDWVLKEACNQVNAWACAGLSLAGRLAINVSALQLDDPGIVDRLLDIVRKANLSPDRFELELTESSMMVAPERAVEVMALLSAAGFNLSIDDFGTGYSSLAYLKRFTANQIKIDISFVRNMLTDANDHTIVTTIIAMARSLGLQTTAEGVEEAGQAAALLSLGCDFAQGYYFGRPEPPHVFMEKWLEPPTTA